MKAAAIIDAKHKAKMAEINADIDRTVREAQHPKAANDLDAILRDLESQNRQQESQRALNRIADELADKNARDREAVWMANRQKVIDAHPEILNQVAWQWMKNIGLSDPVFSQRADGFALAYRVLNRLLRDRRLTVQDVLETDFQLPTKPGAKRVKADEVIPPPDWAKEPEPDKSRPARAEPR